MKTPRFLLGCLTLGLAVGCSSVTVVKNPDENDLGIRYYRPKPYLLVTPADATGRMVNIKLQYLPDFSEEYSIRPKGRKPPAVALEDGWNLVGVGGPPAPPKPQEPAAIPAAPTDPTKLPEFVVAATNVPMGYYESVFDMNGEKKILKGWRYIGLSPIAGGDAIGVDPKSMVPPGCPPPPPSSSMPGPLYGMVFFNGVMNFRQLDEIANNQTCPQYVKILPEKPEPTPAPRGDLVPNKPAQTGGGTQSNEPPAAGGIKPNELDGAGEPLLEEIKPAIPSPPTPDPATPVTPGEAALELAPAEDAPTDAGVSRSSLSIPPPKLWDARR